MGGKSTPLNDFFRGRDVVPEERTRTPLLCDAVGIVWVVGHRIAERVKVTEQTRDGRSACAGSEGRADEWDAGLRRMSASDLDHSWTSPRPPQETDGLVAPTGPT